MMDICRLCLGEGIGYPSIYTAKSYVHKLVGQMENVTGIKLHELSTWPTQICPECMGEAAGVINFCERIKQTQLTIEARYGKRPTTPPPIPLPSQIVHNMDLLIPGPASTVYEIKYIDEMEDLDIGGPLSTFVGDVKPMSPRKRKAETPIEEEEEEEQEPEEVVKPRPMRNAKKAVTTPKKDPDWNISSDQSREDTELLPAVEVNTLMRDFGVLTCKLCPEEIQFQDFKSTKTHNDQEHSLKGVSCCDKTYSSRVRLYEHVKFHLAPEDIECDVCHKKFKSKANLKTHKEDQHAEQVIQCSSCEFTCKSENTLKRHELKHIPTDQRPVSCSECEFKCNYASQLTIHIKSRHSAVKEAFLCGICEKTFSTKGNLTNHHKSFHDTESHRSTCGQCGKAVRRLSRHLNICQKKLDLKCPHCPNVHPNEHALKTHITRIHMTDKSKLTCPECGKVLSRESHLKEHMAKHTQTAPYHCQFCKKEFYSSSNMYKHLRNKHNEEWEEQKELANA